MRSKVLRLSIWPLCLLVLSVATSAQGQAKRQTVVALADGGFVAFKSETTWTDQKKVSPEMQRVPAVLDSQALADENRIVHRVLKDARGRFIFGYDLSVTPNPALKQFKIVVRPLDPQFEIKLRTGNSGEGEPPQSEVISTFPNAAAPQTLEDGDAFSLDLLVNQNTGVKIIDVVRVAFDRSNMLDHSPPLSPRDFAVDAVELVLRDYRLLVNGSVVSASKSTKTVNGSLLWFYVPDRGRFIVSLVPREGYEFQKVGILEDNRIEFTVRGDHYEWLSSSPILQPGTWNIWVLHDPTYTPLFGSQPPPARKRDVFEKIDETLVTAQENAVRLRTKQQATLNSKANAPGTEATGERPRVMVGAADRIENLWPKGP